MSEPHIVVDKLVKTYGDRTVLHGVDLTIDRAQTLVIIGGSGAGQSPRVRHLIALERPPSGRIVIDGTDRAALGDVEAHVVDRAEGPVVGAKLRVEPAHREQGGGAAL